MLLLSEIKIIFCGCLLSIIPTTIFAIGYFYNSNFLIFCVISFFVIMPLYWFSYSQKIDYHYRTRENLDFYDYRNWILKTEKKVFVLVSLIPLGFLIWVWKKPKISFQIFQLKKQVELYTIFEGKTWESITEFKSDLQIINNKINKLPKKERWILLKAVIKGFQHKLEEEITQLFFERQELIGKNGKNKKELYLFLSKKYLNDNQRIIVIKEYKLLMEKSKKIEKVADYARVLSSKKIS